MKETLQKRLNTFDGCSVVIASMVGSGIFTAAGYGAGGINAVPFFLGLWIIGGIYSLCGALCYAELGTRMPEAGGEYVYLREAYGETVAFLSGWISFTAAFSGAIAVFSLAFVSYFSAMIPSWKPDTVIFEGFHLYGGIVIGENFSWGRLAAIGVVVGSTLVHIVRYKIGMIYQNVLTSLKVLAMIAFISLGFLSAEAKWENIVKVTGDFPTLPVLAAGFAVVLFSFSGWNAAAYMSEEFKNPRRMIVRALVGGTLVVTLLYILMNIVYSLGIPISNFGEDDRIAYRAAKTLMGGGVAGVFAGVFSILLLATVGANVLTGPRVYFSMARDGLFPKALCGGVNRWGVPQRAVIFQGLMAILLLLVGGFQALVYWVSFVMNVCCTLAVLSLVIIRRRDKAHDGFKVPFYPLPLIVFCIISGFFSIWIFWKYPDTSKAGLFLINVGLLVYVVWRLIRRENKAESGFVQ